jgi:hypothetical protein
LIEGKESRLLNTKSRLTEKWNCFLKLIVPSEKGEIISTLWESTGISEGPPTHRFLRKQKDRNPLLMGF